MPASPALAIPDRPRAAPSSPPLPLPSPDRLARGRARATAARVALIALIALIATACGTPTARRPSPAAETDAPYQLADDGDLAERRDALWAMTPGPARSALRLELAAALADRARGWLAARRVDRLGGAIEGLAELWFDEPAALAGELAVHRELLLAARAAFARAGADRPAALTLALLATIDPATAADHRAELDLIVAYADDLARSRHGALGADSGAIDVLDAITRNVDDPAAVEREVELLIARANRADATLAQLVAGGARPTNPIYRLALHASLDLTVTLALHHQADRIASVLGRLTGLGRDRRLLAAAVGVAAPAADAAAWAELAAVVRDRALGDDAIDDDGKVRASRAALAACLDGLVRFPDDPTLLAAAAAHAGALDRLAQPIDLLERARARAPADPELARRLADLYRDRLGRLGAAGRPRAAAARLEELRRFLADVARTAPDPGWAEREAVARATYGRALVGLGQLDAARAELARSIARTPTVLALEMLGTIAWKKGDLGGARKHLTAAIALGDDSPAARYARAKLLRLLGDVAEEAGDRAAATQARSQALAVWADLGRIELPPALAGERLVESARLLWGLDRPSDARDLFDAAMDADPDGADTFTQTVTFLLTHDEYDRARDAYYQALASDRIGDYFKVYLGLWILAEGRRLGLADDRIAADYLRGRDGPLWFDDVARAATGRIDRATLDARATTFARRTEATFYAAVLGIDGADAADRRRALGEVVASDLVLFFEYDLARSFLARPARQP